MKLAGIVFLLLQICSVASHAQFIAGNHGEGVLLGGKIYLRDLYIRGQLEDLYFGHSAHPQIAERMSGFDRIELTDLQRQLLVQKISDIEALSPCLGKIVSDIFYTYNWTWTREQFRTPPESEEVTHIPEHQRVIVAKRYRSDVLLQKAAWDKMPDAHKVALLIHEVIYSVLRPSHKPGVKGAAYQDVHVARALVSLFFSKPSVYSSSEFATLARDLDIPTGMSCEAFSHYALKVDGAEVSTPSSALRSDSRLEVDLTKFCQNSVPGASREFKVSLNVQTSAYSFQERRYTSFDGQDGVTGTGRQTWIKVCLAPVFTKTTSFIFSKAEICKDTLKKLIFDWGNPKDLNPSPKGCDSSPW